jgi:hypothetical protein
MIEVIDSGSFKNTESFLNAIMKLDIRSLIEPYAQEGVRALASATPVDSGLASRSWYYDIEQDAKGTRIIWKNSDVESGFPVAVMLQYGYGTGTGGYVQGVDYINPAIRPIMDRIANDVWKAVTSA